MEERSIITFENVTFAYNGEPVLLDVNLNIMEKEIIQV